MIYRTECPRCGEVSEFTTNRENPRINCGGCLMDYAEVVEMTCTPARLDHKSAGAKRTKFD